MQVIVLVTIIAILVIIYSKYIDKQYQKKKESFLKKYNQLLQGMMKGNDASVTFYDESSCEMKFIINCQTYRMHLWIYHGNELLIDFYDPHEKKILKWEFNIDEKQENILRIMGLDIIRFSTSLVDDSRPNVTQEKTTSIDKNGESISHIKKDTLQKMSEKHSDLVNGLCALKEDAKIVADDADMVIISMYICNILTKFYIISPDIEGNINIWTKPKNKILGFKKDWKFRYDDYELDMVCKIMDDLENYESDYTQLNH